MIQVLSIPVPASYLAMLRIRIRDAVHFDQCDGSGMFIPDPDFYPSRIPDLGSRIRNTHFDH